VSLRHFGTSLRTFLRAFEPLAALGTAKELREGTNFGNHIDAVSAQYPSPAEQEN